MAEPQQPPEEETTMTNVRTAIFANDAGLPLEEEAPAAPAAGEEAEPATGDESGMTRTRTAAMPGEPTDDAPTRKAKFRRARTAAMPGELPPEAGDAGDAEDADIAAAAQAGAQEAQQRIDTTEVTEAVSSDATPAGAAPPAAGEVDVASPEPAVQELRPYSPKKEVSLLGSSLSQRPASREARPSSNSGSRTTRRPIVDRYAYEVRETDRNRKIGYLPMHKQVEQMPTGRDVARDMRDELRVITDAAGGAHMVSKVPGTREYTAAGPTFEMSPGEPGTQACQVCGNPWKPEAAACPKCGKKQPGIGWDLFLTQDRFQKRLQFLHENARTGTFTEQYGDDGKYEGEFLTGMRHGRGKYEFRDEVYEGEWKWDQRHGQGKLRGSDGSVIEGEWQNDKPHGFATVTTFVDSKGTVVYEGEFKDGKRHGLGRQLFESGDMYDGGWQNGRLHDRGVYYFTNGDRLYGMWREGVYDGVGVFHYADGSISRREYRDGLLMSVQDCQVEQATLRFGKTLTRDGMQRHTRDRDFPKEVFLLNTV